MSITQDDINRLAAVVSSDPQTLDYGAGGVSDPSGAWESFQRATAKTLLADPDVLLYLAYLCSNKTAAAARKILPTLEALINAVEGLKYAQKAVSSPSKVRSRLSTALAGETATASQVSTLTAEAEKYIAEELAPAISSGSRLQVQGDEARAQYEAQKTTLLDAWSRLTSLVERCSEARRFTSRTAQELTQASALAVLEASLDQPLEGSTTEYTLRLAAATAIVQASQREVDWRYRLRIDTSTVFPSGITAELSGTTLNLNQDALLLGFKSGDLVSWGGETSVKALSGTALTLKGAVDGTGVLQVRAIAVPAWNTLSDGLKAVGLPTAAQLRIAIQSREGGSAGHIRDLVVYLAELYSLLDTVTAGIQGTVSRLGGSSTAATSTLIAVLDAYAPFFPSKTIKAGDALLDRAESGGFDYAVRMLLRGDIDGVFAADAQDASLRGRVDKAVTNIGRYTS